MPVRLRDGLSATLADALTAPPDNAVEHTIHRWMCLLASAVTIGVVAPMSAWLHMPPVVTIGTAVFGLGTLGLYAAAVRGRYYTEATFLATLCMIAGCWFPAAGTSGSALLYQGSALVYAVVMFRGRWRVLGVVALVAISLCLIATEHYRPELVQPFRSADIRMLQVASGVVASTGLITLVLGAVVSAYDRERSGLRVSLAALDASRRTLDGLFDLNPDAVFVVDPREGRCLRVNQGFEHLFGWNRNEVSELRMLDTALWVEPDDRDDLVSSLAADAHVHERVSRVRRRDGGEFWGSITASWIEDADGRLMLFSIRDVTDRVTAQQELAASRATLAALVNSTNDMVWLVEPQRFGLTQFNAAFADYCHRHLGVQGQAGVTPLDLHGEEDGEIWRGYYQRALIDGPFTTEHVGRGGRVLLVSLSPVTSEGAVLGVSAFSHDITDRRADELAKAELERQLQQSQKMESLGRLAGGVAHDFNNMLSAIGGFAQILREQETDPDKYEQLDAICHATHRSGQLTAKLLAFGRRGKNIVEPVVVQGIVRDCLVLLTPSLRPDVRVELDLRESWTVDGDPSQISQAVLNLCLNASEAMPDGGVLRIATRNLERAAPGGDTVHVVELVIGDTGIGMADDVKSRIFEPFYTTKPGGAVSGTGLGLATVHGVVHLHGGAVDVVSALGRGSTFTIQLPRGRFERQDVRPATTRVQAHGTVLVVDDEPLIRSVATRALRTLGYRALVAPDGVEGVRLFREHHAALAAVLLDLKMPRMGGSQAFSAMHAIDASIPILICTGYGDNEEVQQLIQEGAMGLLAKPFTLKDFSDALAKLRA